MTLTPTGSTSFVFENVDGLTADQLCKNIVKQCEDVNAAHLQLTRANRWSLTHKLDELRRKDPTGYHARESYISKVMSRQTLGRLEKAGPMFNLLRGTISGEGLKSYGFFPQNQTPTEEDRGNILAKINPLSTDELNALTLLVTPDRLERTLANRAPETWTAHCRAFIGGETSLKAIESKEATQAEVNAISDQMRRASNGLKIAEVEREAAREKAKELGVPPTSTDAYKRANSAVQHAKRAERELAKKQENLQQRVDNDLADLKARAKELEVKLAALREQRSNATLSSQERIFRLKQKIKALKQVLDPLNNWEAKDCGPGQAGLEARIIRGGFASDFYSLRQYLKWYDHYAEEDREAINPLLLEQLRLLTEIRDTHFPNN